ncbi:MAG: TonB-dependent receptor [Bacteroidota bacterium]|nr:TonB-dependent receptor [Bacteroidota bacterium]
MPTQVEITCIGYAKKSLTLNNSTRNILLQPASSLLESVVVSANRTAQKRADAPVAIATINKQTIEDTKAQRLDQLLNKVSGVFMVNLGNEQHEMSIRQPMTTKSLFLYMEDGIPIRTTGVYNHNALLEMNLPAAKSIEVIKGPSSALYGSEAIGGAVNVITQSAPVFTAGSVSVQANDKGYKRADAQIGTTIGKLGVLVSGYYADKKNGPIEFTDFNKKAFTIRTDYRAGNQTNWSNTLAYVDYYSQMTGSIDSVRFFQKNYSTQQTFTYRKVSALRYKSQLTHDWNANSSTNLAFMYRDNSVGQNPAYSIASTSNPYKFRGQINENAFKTYALFVTHTQKFSWLDSKIISGASLDFSPQSYYAKFISINKDSVSGKYTSYTTPVPDSFLSKYKTGIMNMAAYADFECSPTKGLKLVAALRYDAFQYYFINNLSAAAGVKTASTINSFARFTPKLGLTYNHHGIGFYANFSQGYVPPQLTELYSSAKVAPYLLPQSFNNYEIGGWISLLSNKLYADWSIYRLEGKNEIISVRLPDNSTVNQNAGSTRHTGIEYGINYHPVQSLYLRFSATNAKHLFVNNTANGVKYDGKEMSAAPRFTCNAEITWKPAAIPGFRIAAEWQHQGRYFMDDLDATAYKGFDVLNLRAGYRLHAFEIWINALNAGNTYYSVFASKNATSNGSSSYAYNLGDPRELTLGLAWHFGKKIK